jgi:hypothetical protein
MKTIIIIIIIIAAILTYEFIVTLIRKRNRSNLFKAAQNRANKTKKKLLVIGDPNNGFASIASGADYGCGDLCIDLTGCPKCPNSLKTKLEDVISKINLNEYVIYISCVLEQVDDLPKILSYLNKVNPKDLYVVTVGWYSLTSYFYLNFLTGEPTMKNVIYIENNKIKYFENPFRIE